MGGGLRQDSTKAPADRGPTPVGPGGSGEGLGVDRIFGKERHQLGLGRGASAHGVKVAIDDLSGGWSIGHDGPPARDPTIEGVDESGPSREDLLKLRRFVERARQTGSAVPLPQLVTLARELELSAGVTIDFAASETLGAPMVVVRPTTGSTNHPTARIAEPAEDPLAVLSPRELEVAALLAEGLRNKEIARRLSISLATVKDHVHHILDKTGLPGRAAVGIAYIARA